MPNLTSSTYFERTDFGSFGWIAKVPESLLEVRDYFAAWDGQSRSFRSADVVNKNAVYYQGGFQSYEWIKEYLDTVVAFDPSDKWASIEAATRSFRVPDGERLSQAQHLTQPIFSWLKGVLDLKEVYEFLPAWKQQSDSYRVKDGVDRQTVFYQDQPASTGWIAQAAGLIAPYDPADGRAAIAALLESFRMLDGKALDLGLHITQPVFSWLKVPASLSEVEVSDCDCATELGTISDQLDSVISLLTSIDGKL